MAGLDPAMTASGRSQKTAAIALRSIPADKAASRPALVSLPRATRLPGFARSALRQGLQFLAENGPKFRPAIGAQADACRCASAS
jgi:hypothetical protein